MTKPLLLAFALAFAGVSPAAAEGEAFLRAEIGTSDVDYDIDDFASGNEVNPSVATLAADQGGHSHGGSLLDGI